MISYSYYSLKCAKYLFGEHWGGKYVYVYLASLPLAAIWAQDTVLNMLDTAFALMAIPTVTSTLLLSGRVMAATREYFRRAGARRT
jgi:AGCS family alanine or glycine:cation symporter